MKNFESVLDEIYEFFDEILGSIIPGLYFCSYGIFIIFTYLFVFTYYTNKDYTKGAGFVIVFLFVVAYVIGTMFRRSNSREPDFRSAKHIYFNSLPIDDNDFSFVKLISNSRYDEIVEAFLTLKKNKKFNIKISNGFEALIKSRGTEANLFYKLKYWKKLKKGGILPKPLMLMEIYKKANKMRNRACITQSDRKLIDDFLEESHLAELCDLHVEYPYGNLKQYLIDRGMKEFAEEVSWEFNKDNSITTRSKSFIGNKKDYIKHYSLKDYMYLQKIEAHIRFMNALWYANKALSKLAKYTTSFFGLATISGFIIYSTELVKRVKDIALDNSVFQQILEYFVRFYHGILTIVNDIELNAADGYDALGYRVILSSFLAFLISLTYHFIGKNIKNTILNNFHYQRIREVVTVLNMYDIVKKSVLVNNEKKNNED